MSLEAKLPERKSPPPELARAEEAPRGREAEGSGAHTTGGGEEGWNAYLGLGEVGS